MSMNCMDIFTGYEGYGRHFCKAGLDEDIEEDDVEEGSGDEEK